MIHSKVTAHMCIQVFTCNITNTSSSLTIGQGILVFHRFGFGCLSIEGFPPAVQQDSGTGCILQADFPGPSEDQLDWLRMFSCHRTHC